MSNKAVRKPLAHVIDVLGNVIGRDQPIMLVEKAIDLISGLTLENEFSADDCVIFDPFCKAGELLLASALICCHSRFVSKRGALSSSEIASELYGSNKYFGLSPDERHHRLSLRTFLGNSNSHDKSYTDIIRNGDYLSEVDGRLDLKKFEKEFKSMIDFIKQKSKAKRIIAVGNPPYQEEDGGAQKSAKPIYHLFVQKLIAEKRITDFILVIPARWFAGGKGLDDFRNEMMASKQIRSIKYFEKSGDVFPTVDIDGGICFLHWSANYDGRPTFTAADVSVELKLDNYDIIPDDPMAYELVEKLRKKWKDQWVSDIAWPRKPFGLSTDYFIKNKSLHSNSKNVIKCIGRNKTSYYIEKSNVPLRKEFIDKYKVCIPGAYGGKKGQRRKTLPASSIFVVKPGEIVTETYMVIDVFDSEKEAKNLASYLGTTFARYFLGLRKITQHIPRERWAWVPYLDFSRSWSDEDLNKYFNLTKSEVSHIKRKVSEWS